MARDPSPRSFSRSSRQEDGETAESEDNGSPTKGFGDITDGTSNTLVVGERAAVVEPSTEEFDEADALFGRRTEVRDTEPAKAPDADPESENAEFVPPAVPPTPPGVPVPYPNTARSGEEEELQQLGQPAFGRGASNDEVDPTNPDPVLADSPDTDSTLEDFHDPLGDTLDDPFETADPDDAPVFDENAGVELDIEDPAGDLDLEVDLG